MIRAILALICTFIMVGWFAPSVFGQDESQSTEKLIEQLGSKSFAERDQAGKLLQKRGPVVLPALRKASAKGDAERQRRVTELIAVLNAIRALEPKRVSLGGKDHTLQDMRFELDRQTGMTFEVDDDQGIQTYCCEFKDLPFWEAVERIGIASGTGVDIDTRLFLKPVANRPRWRAIDGPFRLEAIHFHEDRDIYLSKRGKGPADHLLTLSLTLLAEPRFNLLSVEKVQIDAAIDEYGKSLGIPVRESKSRDVDDPERPDFRKMFNIYLQRSSARATTLKELRGSIVVQMVIERKNIVVTQKILESKGKVFTLAGCESVEVTSAGVDEDGKFEFGLQIVCPSHPRRMHWSDRFFVEDANGNRLGRDISWSRGTNIIELKETYCKPEDPKVGPPARLIAEDWVILHHSIPFVFKDIPMP